MARGRFLNASIAVDIELNSLSLEAHWLYMMTIPHLDRDGLIIADTYVFFGKVCPRRPELIPRVDALIAEWVTAGLVIVYPTHDGMVAFFLGFTKNQQGMHYSREGASILQPPPGYVRTDTGLEPNSGDSGNSGGDTPCGLTPDELLTNSRPNPPHVHAHARAEVKSQVKSQVEVKVEVEVERATPPAAAPPEPDVARLWAKWDANMPGTRTPVIVDAVNVLLIDYSVAEIEEAISIACKQNKRNLRYIEGILAKGAFSDAPPGNGYMSKGERQLAEVDKAFALLEERGMPLH